MYKGAQDKQDWMARVGSHSMRPILNAKVNPKPFAEFEAGRLADLRDEKVRLLKLLETLAGTSAQLPIGAKLGAINLEIKRLNREASETSERQLMWEALRQSFSDDQVKKFSDNLVRLRMISQGESS